MEVVLSLCTCSTSSNSLYQTLLTPSVFSSSIHTFSAAVCSKHPFSVWGYPASLSFLTVCSDFASSEFTSVIFSFSASFFASLAFFSFRQRGPYFINTQQQGLERSQMNAMSVYVQPLPKAFGIAIIIADAPALSRHLIRLLAAVAVAGRSG